jgi:uncharacterized membrane-anchored protein YjiN (DUF445 family)
VIDEDVIRIEKLYHEVRNSVKFTDDISIQPNSQADQNTVDACSSNILDLKNTEKQNRRCERIIQYRLGGEIQLLRKLCKTKKHFEMVVKESLEYSASYAYFLMRLHEACNEFINLKFTTISISKLKHDFDSLIELMRHDLAFWSPPSDVPTPTGSC